MMLSELKKYKYDDISDPNQKKKAVLSGRKNTIVIYTPQGDNAKKYGAMVCKVYNHLENPIQTEYDNLNKDTKTYLQQLACDKLLDKNSWEKEQYNGKTSHTFGIGKVKIFTLESNTTNGKIAKALRTGNKLELSKDVNCDKYLS